MSPLHLQSRPALRYESVMNTSVLHILRPFYDTVLVIVAAVFLYGLILRRCAQAVQPSRLRMIDLSRRLECGNLSEDDRAILKFSLDHAFSAWLGIATVILLPVAFFVVVAKEFVGKKQYQNDTSFMMKEFIRLSFISTLAANPIAGMIILFEVSIFFIFTVVLFGQDTAIRIVLTKTARNTEIMSCMMSSRRFAT